MASTIAAEATTAPHNLTPLSNATELRVPQVAENKRGDVLTTFNYFKDSGDGSLPHPTYVGKPETFEQPIEVKQKLVHDIRGEEDEYSLDTTGFQVIKHASKEKDFQDDDQIKEKYYPEVEQILKAATGASKVFIFDHTIRRQTAKFSSNDPPASRGPVQRVHIDQSYKAGPERVTRHLPQESERLLRGRYQIINTWRPIKTIRKDPLAVADATSVPDEDLLPVQLIYPDRVGETFTVKWGPGHKWFFLREQSPEEVLLIKCFDSKTDGRARRAPHSAFVNEEFENERARESIEVRALVFHEDDVL